MSDGLEAGIARVRADLARAGSAHPVPPCGCSDPTCVYRCPGQADGGPCSCPPVQTADGDSLTPELSALLRAHVRNVQDRLAAAEATAHYRQAREWAITEQAVRVLVEQYGETRATARFMLALLLD